MASGGLSHGGVGDGVGAFYGWGPLHLFHKLLAAEACPLFDLDYTRSDHPMDRYPGIIAFLRATQLRWAANSFADGPQSEVVDDPSDCSGVDYRFA